MGIRVAIFNVCSWARQIKKKTGNKHKDVLHLLTKKCGLQDLSPFKSGSPPDSKIQKNFFSFLRGEQESVSLDKKHFSICWVPTLNYRITYFPL